MEVQKTAPLTKNDLVQMFWLDFLQEVKDNITNLPGTGENFHVQPTEIDFWKWFVKEKLDLVQGLNRYHLEAGDNNGEVAQESQSEQTVEPKRTDK